jgi:hypothetical protein
MNTSTTYIFSNLPVSLDLFPTIGRWLVYDKDPKNLFEIEIIETSEKHFKLSTGAWFPKKDHSFVPVENLVSVKTEKDELTVYKGCSPYTMQYVPNCCKGCPNHPVNGGSGFCNCTAPLHDPNYPFRVTFCTTSTNDAFIKKTSWSHT